MKNLYQSFIASVLAAGAALAMVAAPARPTNFDLTKFRYKLDDKSVFSNKDAKQSNSITEMIERKTRMPKATVENPAPALSFAVADQTGNIDAPNGELWYYTGNFEYTEIPPHGDVYFTDRILQSWTFNIYNSKMELIGTIKDKMDYGEEEVRVVMCEITPVATRNFFNTDDKVEIIVALAVNRSEAAGYGNNYRSLVYSLNGEKDAAGDDVPVDIMPDIVGDVIEGPAAADGSDNFYITLMTDVFDNSISDADPSSFWPYLLAQKVAIAIYGKALDDKGPRKLHETVIPLIQLPGDQENIGPMMSMVRDNQVVYCISYYKEPFYNRYDDPLNDDMTQREGNSLIIELYTASETGLTKFSTTEIPVVRDPMLDSSGQPTCLFSYFSVGNLRYTGDILFNAPGASATAPDFIVTRGNYQVSIDGTTNSYFTYKNNGTLKNTLFVYADGTVALGELPGYEPQQVFVSKDAYGYLFNFVNLYSGKKVTTIEADYYYDDDSDPELLTANVARFLDGGKCKYVFELRYPLVDENENDILRFIYIDENGAFDHIDYVNMGKGVAYAQSFLSTEALAPHAYSVTDVPTYMFLVKRGAEDGKKNEELMIAQAETTENPDGKTLLQIGPTEFGPLASIVPEFATKDQPGRLFVYYVNSSASQYMLDIYALPIDDESGVDRVEDDNAGFTIAGGIISAEGQITVYTIDGRVAATATGSFDTASLNNGFYLLVAGGKTYKFIKK
ncbi:MAG: T9SS type A sorting domain-containing protein [Muribaculaceae bacterium]|nr:T9SS type A sorting domain-containing protein [Muribaculaceae bacterium]